MHGDGRATILTVCASQDLFPGSFGHTSGKEDTFTGGRHHIAFLTRLHLHIIQFLKVLHLLASYYFYYSFMLSTGFSYPVLIFFPSSV